MKAGSNFSTFGHLRSKMGFIVPLHSFNLETACSQGSLHFLTDIKGLRTLIRSLSSGTITIRSSFRRLQPQQIIDFSAALYAKRQYPSRSRSPCGWLSYHLLTARKLHQCNICPLFSCSPCGQVTESNAGLFLTCPNSLEVWTTYCEEFHLSINCRYLPENCGPDGEIG